MVANDFLQDLYFIYLDIDTYIQEDLTTMFNQIKDKKLIYGVIDTYQTIRIELQNIKKEHFENISQIYEGYYKKYLALDFHKYLHSINTGSIIVSTKFLSTLDKTAFFSLARENDYMDQDLVNLYCFNNITNIGIRYNFALHMFHGNEMNLRIHSKQNPFTIFNFSKDKLYNKLIEASVIHYSIEIKPTYIFNQLTYELIKKLKSFDDFFNLVTTINNLNNYSLYNSLDQYDQKLLFELNKT
jgi:lipopolysaccharide biosynthesis glycosyltransferase